MSTDDDVWAKVCADVERSPLVRQAQEEVKLAEGRLRQAYTAATRTALRMCLSDTVYFGAIRAHERPGEQTTVYKPSFPLEQRQERDLRIGAALSAGEPPEAIAKRENVSKRHLRRIRARILGGW